MALILIIISILMEWNWVWGAIFIMWAIPSFYSGKTYLVQEIDKNKDPILFWLILMMWVGLSAYLIIADILTLLSK